jgi:hypothetical protein
MSHCRFDRLSPHVAVTLGSSDVAPDPCWARSGAWMPNWLVADTPWIRRSFFIVAANPSFEDLAMVTPICG